MRASLLLLGVCVAASGCDTSPRQGQANPLSVPIVRDVQLVQSISLPTFYQPTGIAVGPEGVYVANGHRRRIHRYDHDGNLIGNFPASHFDLGDSLQLVVGLALEDGVLWATDKRTVWGLDPVSFTILHVVPLRETSTVAHASDVAVSGSAVFVLDRAGNTATEYTRGGSFVAQYGGPGLGPFDYREPLGVAAQGRLVWVADHLWRRVLLWDVNSITTPTVVALIEDPLPIGFGPASFAPFGIEVDSTTLYVCDSVSDSVLTYNALDGTPLGGFDALSPYDVAIYDGKAWVTERQLDRISVWELP